MKSMVQCLAVIIRYSLLDKMRDNSCIVDVFMGDEYEIKWLQQ